MKLSNDTELECEYCSSPFFVHQQLRLDLASRTTNFRLRAVFEVVKENESVGRHTHLKRDPMGVLPFLRNEERLLNRIAKGVKLFMKVDCCL